MSEFDLGADPRLTFKQLKDLEKRVKALEASSVAYSAQQIGPLPGSTRAITINDPNQAGSMWMNFTNAGPGLGPYSAVTDTSNVVRAEWGNLAANGNSPAQYGFRANDAAGVPIFDSLGLIGVMSILGSFTDNNADTINSTTPAVLGGVVTTTFSVTRTVRVLAMVWATGKFTTATAGNFASGFMFLDGVSSSPELLWDRANTGYIQTSAAQFLTLAAGSHTVDFRMSVDNVGLTWTNFQTVLDVFLLGG